MRLKAKIAWYIKRTVQPYPERSCCIRRRSMSTRTRDQLSGMQTTWKCAWMKKLFHRSRSGTLELKWEILFLSSQGLKRLLLATSNPVIWMTRQARLCCFNWGNISVKRKKSCVIRPIFIFQTMKKSATAEIPAFLKKHRSILQLIWVLLETDRNQMNTLYRSVRKIQAARIITD